MRLLRPPFILAHPGDNAGCGFHRVYRPLELLGKAGVAFGIPTVAFVEPDKLQAMNPDIVVFQRQNERHQIEVMKQYRALLPKAFFVYEIDDALSAVPEKSWHRPFMPMDVDTRTKEAVALCDAVTVTTHDLAKHMREICAPGTDVRVAPNMLGRDDFANAQMIRMQTARSPGRRFRIGWGGGISHVGDLEILNKCMVALKDKVEWAFIGMMPTVPEGVKAEFFGAYPPHQYLQALASIDADLIVAPLEDNKFNRCKSNLRLLEAGACKYPVMASQISPYEEGTPPVIYAKTEDDWAPLIENFIAKDANERGWAAERLQRWVERNYILDDKAPERLELWLPKNVKAFVPKAANPNATGIKPIVICAEDLGNEFSSARTLQEACERTSAGDIIYVRPGARVTAAQVKRLMEKIDLDTASVSALGNDSGAACFPKPSTFTNMDPVIADKLDVLASEHVRTAVSPTACGPLILLRRTALAVIGVPDFSVPADIAIIEWSAMASHRGFKNVVNTGIYVAVSQPLSLTPEAANLLGNRILSRWQQKDLDAKTLAEAREILELKYHRDIYKFAPPQNQGDYAKWLELINCLGSTELENMREWQAKQSVDISTFECDPYAPLCLDDLPESEWILFHNKGSKLEPHAVACFINAIQSNPDKLVFYCDHDYLNPQSNAREGHDFKPNFDLHMFLSRDYITPVFAIKADALHNVIVGPDEEASSYFYSVVLSVIQEAGRDTVEHVPLMLATMPLPNLDSLALVTKKKIEAANDFMATGGWPWVHSEPHPIGMGVMFLRYASPHKPHVAIIIPTKNKTEMLGPCIATLTTMTKYPNYSILIVDNGSTNPQHKAYLAGLTDPRITVVNWDEEYNWSKLNNWAVKQIDAPFYCFLNDDTRVVAPDWLDEMMGAVQIPDVGTVGARLMYPQGAIQHIGVVCDIGVNGHTHKGVPAQSPGYQGLATLSHEVTCSTGACLVVPKTIFEEVGGFDEELARNFNDVIFGIRVRELGYKNVLANRAELQHLEGVTRNADDPTQGMSHILREGKIFQSKTKARDPYWNWNLRFFDIGDGIRVAGLNYDALNWTRKTWPWSDPNSGTARIAVIGPPQSVMDERGDGNAIYELSVSGNFARIVAPMVENVRNWDMRTPDTAKAALNTLGIDRIVVSSLREMSVQVLGFLTHLGIPITYRPLDVEAGCPQGDLTRGKEPCNGGWSRGECQSCVNKFNTPYGYVNVFAWRAEWMAFLAHPLVEIDITYLENEPELFFNEMFKSLKQKAA